MKDKIKKICLKIIMYVFLGALALTCIYPLIWMVFNSLKNNDEIFSTNVYGFPTHFRFENYVNAITQFNIMSFFKNSVIVATVTVVCTLIIAMMFAYATARMKWKFCEIVRTYGIIGMFIPVQIIIIPLVMVVRNFHLQNTLLSIIVPYIVFNLSFTSMVFYAYFRSIPVEMEESAAIDGASIYRCFFMIMMPLVKPAVASAGIFVFLNAWNELFTALIVISNDKLKTLPLGLVYFQGQFATDWGASAAALTIASIAPIIIYIIFSDQIEKALTIGGAVKG